MEHTLQMPEKEFKDKLKWLMLFRVLFSTLLLGSSIVLQLGESPPPMGPPLKLLYGLITSIFFLSIIYALIIDRIKKHVTFAYVQRSECQREGV